MNEDLCWKCREDFMVRCHDYGLDGYFADHFLHCHHEPNEKPKCWCEEMNCTPGYRQLNQTVVFVSFCPECGKKL